MKKTTLIASLMILALTCIAAENHVFEAWSADDTEKSSYTTEIADLPLMVGLYKPSTDSVFQFYRLYVTQPQYDAGWDALDQAVKDAGKTNALVYSQTYTNWTTEVQAVVDTLLDYINTIRTDPKLGLPPITKQQIVDKVKSKKKQPKIKKPSKKDK